MRDPNRITLDLGLTIRVSKDGVTIVIDDTDANIEFVEVDMDPATFTAALGGLAFVPVTGKVGGLDRIGKRHECKPFRFPFCRRGHWLGDDMEKHAAKAVEELCPDGWKPDTHFSSQGSFGTTDGEEWAETMIRRWVDKE